MKLISSPSLHSIVYRVFDPTDVLYVKSLVHILDTAPSLRIIDVWPGPDNLKLLPEPSEASMWMQPPIAPGNLHELSCPSGNRQLDVAALRLWTRSTDFTALRTLSLLREWETGEACQFFQYLQANCNFQCLTKLVVQMPANPSDADTQQLRSLLCNLRPLSDLQLMDDVDPAFLSAVLQVHGRKLRKMGVLPCQSHVDAESAKTLIINRLARDADEMRAMLSDCPVLEELKIVIPRHRGGKEEVAMYRALGAALPRLQHLTLYLNACALFTQGCEPVEQPQQVSMIDDPSFDEFDKASFGLVPPGHTVLNGHIRDALINSAVDASLARSIFEVLAQEKPQGTGFPLESVTVKVIGGGWLGDRDYRFSIIQPCLIVGKHWYVHRGIRDDCRGQNVATDISSPHQWHPYMQAQD